MQRPSSRRTRYQSGEEIAPVIDRLAELAGRELHSPAKIRVDVWDDGDIEAVAVHNFGEDVATGVSGREVIKYMPEKGAFVARYIEEGGPRAGVVLERELEAFPA